MSAVTTGIAESAGSRKPTRLNRVHDILLPMIRGKRVLDIGCIGHDFEARSKMGTFYYPDFAKVAAYVKGIDILEADVERARHQGYEVSVGNAETYVDEVPYDVVFAGELIEHLSNAGQFLECCRRNLKSNGALVITTPNTFALSRLIRCVLRLDNEPPLNDEHTCYYTPQTLRQLAARAGFTVSEVYYSDYDYGKLDMTRKKALSLQLNRMICKLAPQFSQSFIAVLRPV